MANTKTAGTEATTPKKTGKKTPAKAPAKGKAVKAAPKAKAAAGGSNAKINSDTKITIIKGAEDATFQEGSMNQQVFAKVNSGQTVKELVKACAKFADEKQVIASLTKLVNPAQKQPKITLK